MSSVHASSESATVSPPVEAVEVRLEVVVPDWYALLMVRELADRELPA